MHPSLEVGRVSLVFLSGDSELVNPVSEQRCDDRDKDEVWRITQWRHNLERPGKKVADSFKYCRHNYLILGQRYEIVACLHLSLK